MYKPTK